MRGELSVCSSSGCGAAFRVRLPLTGHLDRPASTEAPELGALCGSLLLVDDEPMILSVLKLSLEKLGVEVTTASRSTDALELLRSRRFDYLITDRQMPDLSGEDLIRRASPYLVDTDCFLLSGWFSPDEEVGGLKEIGDKAVRLIGKPVVRADLARYLTRKSPS
jgi:DNA-binding response OmpR family regulator